MTRARVDWDAIERDASAWLVRLDEAPHDAALRAEFEQWLAACPEHRVAWEETQALSRLIAGGALPVEDRDGVVVPLRRRRASRWRAAVALAAAACVALLVAPDVALHLQAQEIAPTGEVRRLVLADGSRVELAPGAAFAFEATGSRRTATLLRGTAFFDVARDTARPFRVEVGATEVTVLGTAFEAGFAGEGARVAVQRGLVEVADAKRGARARLRPGETLSLPPGVLGTIRPDRIAAWREGRLLANDRPVREVLDALRPWYAGHIVARGAALDRRRVTGVYDLRDPDAALAALAATHRLSVRRVTPWLRIVTAE